MAADEKRTVYERVHQHGGQVSSVEYTYDLEHTNVGAVARSSISVTRDDYQRLARKTPKIVLSFDQFRKVLWPFMMGRHAVDDIPEAFRLLDTNHSKVINISELAAFMPLMNVSPGVLLDHVKKVDTNGDYKLNLDEFTNFIKKGIGRQLVFGHH
jgi:Ca2+-binding EF-hand superfamily protein